MNRNDQILDDLQVELEENEKEIYILKEEVKKLKMELELSMKAAYKENEISVEGSDTVGSNEGG